jgi:hypothetical protein
MKFLLYKLTSEALTSEALRLQSKSIKMIKFIGNEIAAPLSHIFNLSLTTGEFPSKLKGIDQ